MNNIPLPLSWPEKLDRLDIGSCEPVDKASSVYTAIRQNFKHSKKQFSIRTNPADKLTYVWRIADKIEVNIEYNQTKY